MRKLLVAVIIVTNFFALESKAQSNACGDKLSTSDIVECLSVELAQQEKIQSEYLEIAKQRVERRDDLPFSLQAEQDAWEKYSQEYCGNVYQYWVRGTYRYVAAMACHIKQTQMRTHDIWVAYLTFVDSTPPLLPEPKMNNR